MQEAHPRSERIVRRETNPERINRIIDHPEVHRWVKGVDAGRLDNALAADALIALFGKFGGFLFWRVSPTLYEAQAAILPDGRGRWALRAAKQALRYIFEQEGGLEVMAAAPKGDATGRAFIRAVSRKAKYVGDVANCWVTADGQFIASEIFSITQKDWGPECLSSRPPLLEVAVLPLAAH
jgi:hypothetical protein